MKNYKYEVDKNLESYLIFNIFVLHVICRTNFSCNRDSTLIEIQEAMLCYRNKKRQVKRKDGNYV